MTIKIGGFEFENIDYARRVILYRELRGHLIVESGNQEISPAERRECSENIIMLDLYFNLFSKDGETDLKTNGKYIMPIQDLFKKYKDKLPHKEYISALYPAMTQGVAKVLVKINEEKFRKLVDDLEIYLSELERPKKEPDLKQEREGRAESPDELERLLQIEKFKEKMKKREKQLKKRPILDQFDIGDDFGKLQEDEIERYSHASERVIKSAIKARENRESTSRLSSGQQSQDRQRTTPSVEQKKYYDTYNLQSPTKSPQTSRDPSPFNSHKSSPLSSSRTSPATVRSSKPDTPKTPKTPKSPKTPSHKGRKKHGP